MPDYRRPPAVDRSFGLTRDAFGRLVLIDSEGRRHIGVEPIRAFPITDPDHFIAIVDAEGVELLLIEDLSSLAPAVRQTLEEELARREFVPIIRQIARISIDTDPTEWEVVTDRGPTRFAVSDDDHIRRLGPRRVLITDTRGLRYLIPDLQALDPASRRKIERYF